MGHYTPSVSRERSYGIKKYAFIRRIKNGKFSKEFGPWSQLVELQNVNLNIIYPNKSLKLNKRLSIVPFVFLIGMSFLKQWGLKY